MDKEELLWNYQHEQREIGSKMDQQRTAITNFTISLTAGLIAVLAVQKFGENTILIASYITVLGLYGIITTRKLYERSEFHNGRSRECLKRLDALIGDKVIKSAKDDAKKKSQKLFPIMSKFRTHHIWMFLHFLVVGFGIIIIILALTK